VSHLASSKTCCVSHPDGLPDLFLDRSLGRVKVPGLLRQAGLRLVTLAERYGIPADEAISDVEWLADAGQRSEAVFMKDERIRYNVLEKECVKAHSVRCFCLTRQNLTGVDMAAWFLNNLASITKACHGPGPFIYAVNSRNIRRVPL
jgi:hypothetical protein